MSCPECDIERDHCHEVVVRHADGSLECLGSVHCHAEVTRHTTVVTCVEILDGCGCAER